MGITALPTLHNAAMMCRQIDRCSVDAGTGPPPNTRHILSTYDGQAEACASGARLLRVEPGVPREQQLASVLEALFEAFWWTVETG